MNLEALKEQLRPWLLVSTWDSGHSLDERRFHKALHGVFSVLGTAIPTDDFRQVMIELLNELYPTQDSIDRSARIESFVNVAERIGLYLHGARIL
ncbi:hypothetical protein [Janthinobacterium sp. B9-8]|uniref:hypothetical protein n=1 Tax=Janthinobacterium sp. B9-8 TaxID=1236179 RepID=UPI00061CFABB|nr:hypothetical protein [Janthinobacterium sp. B9-8]AMC35031.1 hypothetical protein VN23_10615 [Janthinobacterium sp. B9-8]